MSIEWFTELPWAIRILAFLWGAVWGSFFNVAIYRWPREMSVTLPASHCPSCKTPIPAWRNIPLFGYLLLRGKASCCGARLSPRYVFVELLSAVLSLAIAQHTIYKVVEENLDPTMATTEALLHFVFVGGLVIATFVDLEWMEIPDEVSLPGAALGLATVSLRSSITADEAAFGAGMGFLLVQVLFVWLYEKILGRRGMGEGDSKLLLMIGSFIGWKGTLFCVLAGSVQGLLTAITMMVFGKSVTPVRPDEPAENSEAHSSKEDVAVSTMGQMKVPFGPFLALGAIEFLFFGDWIIDRYLRIFG